LNGEIRVAELFAGIGGFRLGLEQANNTQHAPISQNPKQENSKQGRKWTADESTALLHIGNKPSFRVVWANEWDKYACQIYRKNFGEKELVEGDVRKISTNDIPDFDIEVGGFPCQPHSLAGKRQGFNDERGEVFHEIVRIAKAKKPKILLLENVKGLLSSEQGKAFGTVLEELGNIGYWCEWQVINSKHHGVPQNRERVFIIGHLRGTSSRQIFPIGENDSQYTKMEGRRQVSAAIDASYYKGYDHKRQLITYWKNSTERWVDEYREDCLTLKGQNDLCRQPLIVADRTHTYANLGRNLESPKEITNALSGVQKDNLVLLDNLGGNIKKGRIKPLDNGTAWTLGGSKTGVQQHQKLRRLTPTECERLQGFPDGWTEGVSDTHRYKCLGNAVTVNVIQFLGEHILEALD